MSLEDQQISQQQHIKQLLQSENWELPKWFTADKVEKIRKYKEHFSFHLKPDTSILKMNFALYWAIFRSKRM